MLEYVVFSEGELEAGKKDRFMEVKERKRWLRVRSSKIIQRNPGVSATLALSHIQ